MVQELRTFLAHGDESGLITSVYLQLFYYRVFSLFSFLLYIGSPVTTNICLLSSFSCTINVWFHLPEFASHFCRIEKQSSFSCLTNESYIYRSQKECKQKQANKEAAPLHKDKIKIPVLVLTLNDNNISNIKI